MLRQSAASTDQDRLLSDNIPVPNQGLSFPSVIWQMEIYHGPSGRWRAELEYVFLFKFVNLCKVPLQLFVTGIT